MELDQVWGTGASPLRVGLTVNGLHLEEARIAKGGARVHEFGHQRLAQGRFKVGFLHVRAADGEVQKIIFD